MFLFWKLVLLVVRLVQSLKNRKLLGISLPGFRVRIWQVEHIIQAQKFGADIINCQRPHDLSATENRTSTSKSRMDSPIFPTLTIMIATGAEYRRPTMQKLVAALKVRAYIMVRLLWKHSYVAGEDVIVVGGGNSAGQVERLFSGSRLRSACTCLSGQPV